MAEYRPLENIAEKRIIRKLLCFIQEFKWKGN